MRKIILYDFDGTLTLEDTTKFLLFELVKLRPIKLFSFIFVMLGVTYIRKSENFQSVKNKAIGQLISGYSEEQLKPAMRNFYKRVKVILRPEVMDSLQKNLDLKNEVIIVSASPEFILNDFFSQLEVQIIGTRFHIEDNKFTGTLKGQNCYGNEKVKRLNEWSKINKKNFIFEAWSDHESDIPMMNLAKNQFWIVDKKKLETISKINPNATFLEYD